MHLMDALLSGISFHIQAVTASSQASLCGSAKRGFDLATNNAVFPSVFLSYLSVRIYLVHLVYLGRSYCVSVIVGRSDREECLPEQIYIGR